MGVVFTPTFCILNREVGSICAQFHNMLSARTAVQPVSQLTRKGLIESIRRVPFGHKWVDRQQAVKTYGRPYRQSSYA